MILLCQMNVDLSSDPHGTFLPDRCVDDGQGAPPANQISKMGVVEQKRGVELRPAEREGEIIKTDLRFRFSTSTSTYEYETKCPGSACPFTSACLPGAFSEPWHKARPSHHVVLGKKFH